MRDIDFVKKGFNCSLIFLYNLVGKDFLFLGTKDEDLHGSDDLISRIFSRVQSSPTAITVLPVVLITSSHCMTVNTLKILITLMVGIYGESIKCGFV